MKFKYYFVAHKDSPQSYLTIVENKKQASEFINNNLYILHINEFKSWCYYNERAEDTTSWKEYFDTRIPDSEKTCYVIGSKDFSKEQVAAILRMFAGCMPKGCSYERSEEYEYFGNKLIAKQNLVNKVQQMTEEQLKKLDERLQNATDQVSDLDDDDTGEIIQ